MPTPDFVVRLRDVIGHAPIPLVGVTAIVLRGDEVLLGRRADNGALQPVSGIVETGEEPADAAVREVREEAGVQCRATRLALVHQMPRVTYANGDEVDYLTLTFRCEWVCGDPHPADGELTDVGWYDVDGIDALAGLDDDHRRRIAAAIPLDGPAMFAGGDAGTAMDPRWRCRPHAVPARTFSITATIRRSRVACCFALVTARTCSLRCV